MKQDNAKQAARDEKLVPLNDRVKIGKSNLRMDPFVTQREETYQVVLDIIKNTPFYNAFLIFADVPEIYMQQFWLTITKVKKFSFYQFDIDNKTCINLGEPLELSSTDVYRGRNTWITNEINKTEAYQMYFKYSTGLIPLKKGRGKEAKEGKKTVTPQKPTKPKKKPSKKKQVLSQFEIDTQKAMKASKRTSRFQHQIGGLSKGAGLRPKGPDEPLDKSANSDEGVGTSSEVLDESRDKNEARYDLDDWGSTDDEKYLLAYKDDKPEDIPWQSTDDDESENDDEEDDASIDIEKTDDERTDT
ncbi:hypothetical protein Tco_1416400, partial [Tanacetum coccineum]